MCMSYNSSKLWANWTAWAKARGQKVILNWYQIVIWSKIANNESNLTQIELTRYYIFISLGFSPQVPKIFSKATRYVASRCADLADMRFWIGSKNTWDIQTLTKSLADTWILRGFLLTFAKFVLILGVIKVIKIRNKFFKPTFLPKNKQTISTLLLVDLFSFVFWKKVKTPKRHFEINWPLLTYLDK